MGREPDGSDEPKWLAVANLPAEALTRGVAWLLDLGVPVGDAATATFQGPGPGSSKERRWCAAECATVVQAAAASRRLSTRVLDGYALKAWPITKATVEKLKDGRMRIEELSKADERLSEASSQKSSSRKTGDKADAKRGDGARQSKSDKKSGKASRPDGRRRDKSKTRRRKRDAPSSSRTSHSVSEAAASPSLSAAAPKRRSLRDRAADVLTRFRVEQDAVDGPPGASIDGNAEADGGNAKPQSCMPVPATARLKELEGALAKMTPGLVMMMNNRKIAAQAQAVAGEAAEQQAKRKAAEAARLAEGEKKQRTAQTESAPEPKTSRAVAPVESTEQRAKRKAAEAVLLRQRERERAKRKAAEEAKRRASRGSLPSLYDDMPEADPENDAKAAIRAEARLKDSEKPTFDYTKDRSKVIFLDIDGVVRPLYGNGFQISSIQMDGENVPVIAEGGTEFMTTAMNALRHIMQETGAVIVLSSEWRRHATLRDGVNSTLRDHGLPSVSDDTPMHAQISFSIGNVLHNFATRRAREIGEWLRGHPDVKQWVALDDIDLGMADEDRQVGQLLITPRFVLTDKSACLTMSDAEQAVRILHGQLNKPALPAKPVEGKDI